MGTRGHVCFRYRGRTYQIYCHYDSYPEGVGQRLLDEIRQAVLSGEIDIWKSKFDSLIIVQERDRVPDDVKPLLLKYAASWITNPSPYVSGPTDFYGYLNKCQGSYVKVFESGYLCETDCDDIEYSYTLDLDTDQFTCTALNDDNEVVYDIIQLPKEIVLECDI
jgi:hypothetical protein